MTVKALRGAALTTSIALLLVFNSAQCLAQGDQQNGTNLGGNNGGGDIGGFDGGGLDIGNDTGGADNVFDTGNVGDTGNNLGNNSFGGGIGGGGGNAFDISNLLEGLETPEDERSQGFVGMSQERIDELGFVGPTAEAIGGSTGGSRNLQFNSGNGNSNTGANSQNGFTYDRVGIRTRRQNAIRTRPIPNRGQFISTTFQNRMQRLPVTQSISGYSVEIQNRTAVITGSVGSQAEADMIIRQMRLQPGVYRIQDRLTVGGR